MPAAGARPYLRSLAMTTPRPASRLRPWAAALPLALGLAGCQSAVLHPAGDVALQQRDLIIASTGLMLLIVLPVMAATALFAWRYRQSNTRATYTPEWSHSTQLEVLIWAGPLAIVVALGALTWISTHVLDPYRPIARLGPGRPVLAAARPLDVEVVALDWKWLFIYPQYGVATVNELAAPVDRPINFKITSSSVMNSFFVPTLAGQIYAMPGMETQMHAVADRPVESTGFSSNYSGSGFSDMRFAFHGLAPGDFDRWIAGVRAGGGDLDRARYAQLVQPSERAPVQHFAAVAPTLYPAILNMCVDPAHACESMTMGADSHSDAAARVPARAAPAPFTHPALPHLHHRRPQGRHPSPDPRRPPTPVWSPVRKDALSPMTLDPVCPASCSGASRSTPCRCTSPY